MKLMPLASGLLAALIAWVWLVYTTGVSPTDDQDLELKHYCEMVQIYRESSGEFGWPDYNNTAHLCTERSND